EVGARVEDAEHGDGHTVAQVERTESEQKLDRLEHAQLVVAVAHDLAATDIWACGERDRPRRVNVVGAVLRVVLLDEYQRLAPDGAVVRDGLDDEGERRVVLRDELEGAVRRRELP